MTATDTKLCCMCTAIFGRRENEHEYLWELRTVCSEQCSILKELSRYALHATHKTDGRLWYVKTTYNRRVKPEHRFVIVNAEKTKRISSGEGKGGRITKEWRAA